MEANKILSLLLSTKEGLIIMAVLAFWVVGFIATFFGSSKKKAPVAAVGSANQKKVEAEVTVLKNSAQQGVNAVSVSKTKENAQAEKPKKKEVKEASFWSKVGSVILIIGFLCLILSGNKLILNNSVCSMIFATTIVAQNKYHGVSAFYFCLIFKSLAKIRNFFSN